MLNTWKLTRSVAFDVYISHFFAHIAHIQRWQCFLQHMENKYFICVSAYQSPESVEKKSALFYLPLPIFSPRWAPALSCTLTCLAFTSRVREERMSKNLLLINNYLVIGSWEFRPIMSHPQLFGEVTVSLTLFPNSLLGKA